MVLVVPWLRGRRVGAVEGVEAELLARAGGIGRREEFGHDVLLFGCGGTEVGNRVDRLSAGGGG